MDAYQYLTETLGSIVYEGYNIVGDGTTAAVMAVLTGLTEEEQPEARRGFAGAQPVDNHTWIWNRLKEYGYITQVSDAKKPRCRLTSIIIIQFVGLWFQVSVYMATRSKNPRLRLGSCFDKKETRFRFRFVTCFSALALRSTKGFERRTSSK